jgi:hypothetical protein
MAFQATAADNSARGTGFGVVPVAPLIIDQLMGYTTFTGNGAASITVPTSNGVSTVDISGGGMVMIKNFASGGGGYSYFDTYSGVGNFWTGASTKTIDGQSLLSFNKGSVTFGTSINTNGTVYAMIYVRSRVGFFDVVGWTGNASSSRTIPHKLGYVPSMMWTKAKDGGQFLCQSNALTSSTNWSSINSGTPYPASAGSNTFPTLPDANNIYIGSNIQINDSGLGFVAYLWGEAAIFGPNQNEQIVKVSQTSTTALTSLQNLFYSQISFLFPSNASNPSVISNMYNRGNLNNPADSLVSTAAWSSQGTQSFFGQYISGPATASSNGFGTGSSQANATTTGYLQIRHPHQSAPTGSNQIVFYGALSGTSPARITAGFNYDIVWTKTDGAGGFMGVAWRYNGAGGKPYTTQVEQPLTAAAQAAFSNNNGGVLAATNIGGNNFLEVTNTTVGNTSYHLLWKFAYQALFPLDLYGTGTTRTVNHGLGAQPDAIISFTGMLSAGTCTGALAFRSLPASGYDFRYTWFSNTSSVQFNTNNFTSWTSTQINYGTSGNFNTASTQIHTWLIATLPNVVFVGSYTGTGVAQSIGCGFSTPAKVLLVVDNSGATTGWWIVWNVASGLICTTANQTGSMATDNQISSYSNGANSGFNVGTSANLNVNARLYNFIAFA